MRRIASIVLAVLMSINIVSAATDEGNTAETEKNITEEAEEILLFEGFENGISGYTLNNPSKVNITTNEKYEGSSCLVADVSADTGNIRISKEMELTPGYDYRVSVFVKSDINVLGPYIAAGSSPFVAEGRLAPLAWISQGKTDWREFTYSFSSGEMSKVNIGINFPCSEKNSKYAYIDNLKVTKIGKTFYPDDKDKENPDDSSDTADEEQPVTEKNYSEIEKLMFAIGAIDKENYDYDLKLTRAEFAYIISSISGLYSEQSVNDDWISNANTADNNDVLMDETISVSGFTDVDESTKYYKNIMLVTSAGFMHGITPTTFGAQYNVTVNEAVKVLVDMLGYKPYAKIRGGYPSGYMSMAAEIGLLRGIITRGTDYMTKGMLVNLIYNALEKEILWINTVDDKISYETREGKTFLSEIVKLEKIKGVLTDNGITAYDGESKVGNNNVGINGKTVRLNSDTEYIRNMLGRHIELYYTNEDNSAGGDMAVFAVVTGKDNCVTFSMEDYESYDQTHISYIKNGNTKTINLPVNTYLIYNGEAKKVYDNSVFENVSYGDVTVIDGYTDYTLIILNSYEHWYVSKIYADDGMVYNGIGNNDSADKNCICLTGDSSYDFIYIYDDMGNRISFNDISVGNVLDVLRGQNIVRVTVSKQIISDFEIKSYTENDNTFLSNGTDQYKVSEQYLKSDEFSAPDLGSKVSLYLNKDGLIVYIGHINVEDKKTGYIINSIYSDTDEVCFVKLFDSDGSLSKYELNEKVNILDGSGTQLRYSYEDVYNKFLSDGKNELIRYKINSDSKIIYIEFPYDGENKEREQLQLTFVHEKDSETNNSDISIGSEAGIDGKIALKPSTVYMKIPEDLNNEHMYSIKKNITESADYYRDMYVYKLDGKSLFADFVIVKSFDGEDSSTLISRDLFIVEKVFDAVNDGETVTAVTGTQYDDSLFKVSSGVTLYAEKDIMKNIYDTPHSMTKNGNTYSVKKGDIIRYKLDNTGMIVGCDLVYRPGGENPEYPTSRQGHLMGTIGCNYSGAFDQTIGYRNPYSISTANQNILSSDAKRWNYGRRFLFGSIVKIQDGAVQVTTQDLSMEPFDLNAGGGRYVINTFVPANTNRIIMVDYDSESGIKSGAGKLEDAITYEDAGSGCSRAIVINSGGGTTILIIINGYLD